MYKLTVFGHPIDHSLSPVIQQAFASQFDIELDYSKTDAPLELFVESLNAFLHEGGMGANVTVPLKEEAFKLCAELSKEARLAQSVNTLLWQGERLQGFNTDGLGLVQDIRHNQNQTIEGKSILIIGAGGATKGIIAPLLNQSPQSITIANRTLSKAESLCKHFDNVKLHAIDLDKLASLTEPFDLIINATSASLGGEELPIAKTAFKGCFAYDLMYSPDRETAFTKQALAHGAKVACDGLGMLVEQGALGFEIWFGQKPQTKQVLDKFQP